MGIISWIIFGLIVGLLARAVLPGRQSMSLPMTMLLGVAGSLLGGFIANALTGRPVGSLEGAGIIGSILGAIALMFVAGGFFGRRRIA
jgi:uncharacterized membrane protein YeaQ/YmgE (transglycosylase-associated protein family)